MKLLNLEDIRGMRWLIEIILFYQDLIFYCGRTTYEYVVRGYFVLNKDDEIHDFSHLSINYNFILPSEKTLTKHFTNFNYLFNENKKIMKKLLSYINVSNISVIKVDAIDFIL
ncbi:hypothetical protein ABK040_013279 [Willaertia magna]